MTMKLPTRLSRFLASPAALRAAIAALLLTTAAHAAEDRYWQWAAAHFGHAIASDPAQKATVWGETANPERDGIPTLV